MLVALADGAAAQPPPASIPELLRPWIEWVLHGHEERRCPFLRGDPSQRRCEWPSRLNLELDDGGGRFTQEWVVYRDAAVPLPGDQATWPQDVRVDGNPAVVIPRAETPSVQLAPGAHSVSGEFRWESLPVALPVPPQTGLLALSLRGQGVALPERDEQGRVWLQKRRIEKEVEDRLEVVAHRLVVDDVPFRLATRITLQVSGRGREELLARVLPPQFVPMAMSSPLPARLEADGRLRVQVRPGTWIIELIARHDGRLDALSRPAADGPWAADEVWVFEARPDLRLVTVEGVTAVDPQQTTLPPEWRSLPAFLVLPNETMRLVEKRRGDADPAPDQLTLNRTWWLDFDGGGYTIHDQVAGTLRRSWRLEMSPPAQLGRVAIAGQDQFITRLDASDRDGVEVRQGQVDLDADSRLTGKLRDLPAVGWDHDVHQLSGELRLPPGWRLLHASGVDAVSRTWINRWTLLDLFVVLIISMSVARLWSWPWGAVALLAVGSTYTEPHAPQLSWLGVLAAETLTRVLPEGWPLRLARLTRMVAVVALVVFAVPFMVMQVRLGLYPALEESGVPPRAQPASVTAPMEERAVAKRSRLMPSPGAEDSGREYGFDKRYYAAVDPKAQVQTGPGLPRWTWSSVTLRWNGPVDASQRLHLYLLPPALNLILAFVRVILLALLAVVVLRGTASRWQPRRGTPGVVAILALLAVLVAPARASADLPSKEMLDELRSRLLEPPPCQPDCASSPRLRLEVGGGVLSGRMEIDVAADVAVPLPGTATQWLPTRVVADGAPAAALARGSDGFLWLQLAPGKHEVLFSGALPERDSVQIALPLKPHRVELRADGWTVEGLYENGLTGDHLEFTRIRTEAEPETLEPGVLPPFVRVQRTLRIGLLWEVETMVQRLTPPGEAVVMEVPLLPGESVVSSGLRVADGKAVVDMAPAAMVFEWKSILPEQKTIVLKAPEAVPSTEVWQLDVTPIWHSEVGGIPPIHPSASAAVRIPEWRPWPGETVTIALTRPEGVEGRTLTVDGSVLALSPGIRASDATLTLDVRSSRGGQHTLTLPVDAQLQSVAINNVQQPIRQEGARVTVPLTPGQQQIQLAWQQSGGVTARYRTPAVDIGAPSVNAEIVINMSADRWTLFLGGPRLGPAVLFWSVLVVLALASFGLSRVRRTPLRWHHWFLLGVGMTQVPIAMSLVVAGWLLALGWRRERGADLGINEFRLQQLVLVLWTLPALVALVWSIERGLLGLPEMQIAGNASSATLLRWYQDQSGPVLPQAWVFSVPLMAYRLAMLAWALWLAQALLRWLRWGWDSFSTGGLWKSPPKVVKVPQAPSA